MGIDPISAAEAVGTIGKIAVFLLKTSNAPEEVRRCLELVQVISRTSVPD